MLSHPCDFTFLCIGSIWGVIHFAIIFLIRSLYRIPPVRDLVPTVGVLQPHTVSSKPVMKLLQWKQIFLIYFVARKTNVKLVKRRDVWMAFIPFQNAHYTILVHYCPSIITYLCLGCQCVFVCLFVYACVHTRMRACVCARMCLCCSPVPIVFGHHSADINSLVFCR